MYWQRNPFNYEITQTTCYVSLTGPPSLLRGSFHYVCDVEAIWFVLKTRVGNLEFKWTIFSTFSHLSLCSTFRFFYIFFVSKVGTVILMVEVKNEKIVGRFNQTGSMCMYYRKPTSSSLSSFLRSHVVSPKPIKLTVFLQNVHIRIYT